MSFPQRLAEGEALVLWYRRTSFSHLLTISFFHAFFILDVRFMMIPPKKYRIGGLSAILNFQGSVVPIYYHALFKKSTKFKK